MSKILPARRTYRAPEAAALFGVTGQTVRNWIRSGQIRGERVGRLWLVDAAEVDRLFPKREAA